MTGYDRNAIKRLNRLTGNYFTPANGYDLRKKLSRSRAKTLQKYLATLLHFEREPHSFIEPKKGEKKLLQSYFSQSGLNKFTKVFVPTPHNSGKPKITVDKKARPDQRVRIYYPKIRQSEFRIPKEYLLYFIMNDMYEEFIDYVDEVAPNGRVYLINGSGGTLWRRSAGNAEALAEILFNLAQRYSLKNFATQDYSYFDNWFESVSIFDNEAQGDAHLRVLNIRGEKAYREWVDKTGLTDDMRLSTKLGGYFVSQDGEMTGEFISFSGEKNLRKVVRAIDKFKKRAKRERDRDKAKRKTARQKIKK